MSHHSSLRGGWNKIFLPPASCWTGLQNSMELRGLGEKRKGWGELGVPPSLICSGPGSLNGSLLASVPATFWLLKSASLPLCPFPNPLLPPHPAWLVCLVTAGKRGSCPAFPAVVQEPCVKLCSQDKDCVGLQKCCPKMCSMVCLDPVPGESGTGRSRLWWRKGGNGRLKNINNIWSSPCAIKKHDHIL